MISDEIDNWYYLKNYTTNLKVVDRSEDEDATIDDNTKIVIYANN